MNSPSPIREDLLHYVWKTKSFDLTDLRTIDGEKIEVQNFGFINTNSGPDFSNGKIKMGKIIWSGNIEMHVFSSQWLQHGHQHDAAYRNVILHVVYEHDGQIIKQNGQVIPTLELKDRIIPAVKKNYLKLIHNQNWIPCANIFPDWSEDRWHLYLSSLMVERLERKVHDIQHIYKYSNGDWERTCFILLAKYIGSPVNSFPMEILSKSLDSKIFLKNKDNELFAAALLFGQAGMLQADFGEDYPALLRKEYEYQRKKWNLTTMDVSIWKFGRLRPHNFPTVRIAMLANIISQTNHLFARIKEKNSKKEIESVLQTNLPLYWDTHFRFGKESNAVKKKISSTQMDLIMINMIAPLLFYYGELQGDESFKEKALHILEEVKPEKNSIINKWKEMGPEAKNAVQSQALIQLKQEYCNHKRCLECQVGHYILKSSSS